MHQLPGVYRAELSELAQTMSFFGSNEFYQVVTRNASPQRVVNSETRDVVKGTSSSIAEHYVTHNNAGLLTADRTTGTGIVAEQQW